MQGNHGCIGAKKLKLLEVGQRSPGDPGFVAKFYGAAAVPASVSPPVLLSVVGTAALST